MSCSARASPSSRNTACRHSFLYFPLTNCRAPPLELVAAAVTARSALECADLERLETLGDAYLKFAVSTAGGAEHICGWLNDSRR